MKGKKKPGNPNKNHENPNRKFYSFFVWISIFYLDFRDSSKKNKKNFLFGFP
jgi:hypothetical protein